MSQDKSIVKTPKKRAMSSYDASFKKIAGHINEHDFAALIGGEVNLGSQQAKKDVIDRQHSFHSVKGGKWWQIFLYRRSHWENNTVFKGLGDISPIMIECLDAFPANRSDYVQDKPKYKKHLEEPMQKLLAELKNSKDILVNAGEIEVRNDSDVHYLEMKCRFDGDKIFALLCWEITKKEEKTPEIIAYDSAINKFQIP